MKTSAASILLIAGAAGLASAQASGPLWKELGCYGDLYATNPGAGVQEYQTQLQFNSPGACGEQCFKIGVYKYAAVQGSTCYCGRDLTNPKVDESECDTECPGYPLDKCGGETAVNIYVNENFEQSTKTTDLNGGTTGIPQPTGNSTATRTSSVPPALTSSTSSGTSLPTGAAGKVYGGVLGVVAAAGAGLLAL